MMASNPPETRAHSFTRVVLSWRQWWRKAVVGTVDQADVINRRRQECSLSARYLFMLSMSAGIAILGLLLSSPAVVIGAMLLSPLMDPIMGVGFALAIGDFHWLKQAGRSLLVGTLLAILFCAFVVLLSPLQTVTAEIAARTRPNLFDLGVALFSALAGTYAMIRGREGTVVGVAIATALMPPLAVVGFGLATLNWTVFTGALLLFVTNLVTIALTAALMARAYGFRTSLTERQTQLQALAIMAVFIALAIPLGISLRQIAWEAQASRTIRGELLDEFDNNARLSQIDINFDAEPVTIAATVLTPTIRSDAEEAAGRAIRRQLGQAVEISITQYQVGIGAKAAEEAQLAAARAREAADRQRAEELSVRLALVAGVAEKDVLLDRERRHALVTAKPLTGAGLATYRELEGRIAATEPEWTIELRPPARPLPAIEFDDGEPTPQGADAIALIGWAAQRLGAPVILSGGETDVKRAAELLDGQGIVTREETASGRDGKVTARWGAPGD
ncbi:hypothetical protein MB02_14600 [Croceicoccus estronivorus]|uniref:DUF389 domain-containing protein n=1 Tax=Croceicoccus estronivorus TaxID=1172626 RepID=UPI00082A18AB|nr:DUF389 domain-containing protein [Croceicoccus estronivorus]OCC22987.1 hypothetical protein MB02_14600 [Croceicoccus estronivorus]